MHRLPTVIGCGLLASLAALGQLVSTTAPNDHPHMRPGTTYLAHFTYAERRETCVGLSYAEQTAAFDNCVQGDFPENPWFKGYRPLRMALRADN